MRHKVAGWKLGRNTAHRRSLLRNLVTSLIVEERIETTIPKAKAMRPHVEKMITLGKRGDLAARRLAASYLMTDEAVNKLFDTVAPRFGDRQGGYLRIVRTAGRRAMAPRRPSSNCWAPRRCSTKSARSVPKPAPSAWRKRRRRWKKPKLRLKRRTKPRLVAAPRKKKKKRNRFNSDLHQQRTQPSGALFISGVAGEFKSFLTTEETPRSTEQRQDFLCVLL